ncbi:MAG: trypsin-like peptidase domain-containing protein, partial [Williamsia herbipolensis]|nr:trypsin-like peptidase domain-containing protein [Williamsia herbipolensis]
RSRSRSVVVTAAHCVYTPARGLDTKLGTPGFATSVRFTPGSSREDNAPRETWTAATMFIDPRYRRDGDITHDLAFLTMTPNQARRVQDVAGALAVRFSGDERATPARDVTVLGYPAAAGFDGLTLRACHAAKATFGFFPGNYSMRCRMTGGTSGGPWMSDVATSAINSGPRAGEQVGDGTVVAVSSHTTTEGPATDVAVPLLASSRVLYDNADREQP